MTQLSEMESAASRIDETLSPERQAACVAVAALRETLKMSLQDFAAAVGLKSAGNMSRLERGQLPCSVRVALAIEELSGGQIDAGALNDDVAAARLRCTGLVSVVPAETGAAA